MVRRLLFLVLLGVLLPAATASAQRPFLPHARFDGQVVALDGPQANPDGFVLQTVGGTPVIRIGMNTTFRPRSAEAEVEGFAADDYAVVTAVRQTGTWVALTVDFDVRPWGAIRQFTVSGQVLHVAPSGRRFVVRDTTGVAHVITVVRTTRYLMDGQPVDTPEQLTPNDTVRVLVRRAPVGLIAVQIDVRTASQSER